MTIRAKSRRRRLLLLLVVGVVSVVGVALYLRREHHLDEAAREARTLGLASYEAGEFKDAVGQLARFIRRLDPDAEALLRYAQAIQALPSPSPGHLGSALATLRRSVQMEPGNVEAREELLDLYVRLGRRTESLTQADWLLENRPGDVRTILAKTRALAALKRYGLALESLEAKEEAVRATRTHLESQLLRLWLMKNVEGRAGGIQKAAAEVYAENEADDRWRLVLAHADLLTGRDDEARAVLRELVGRAVVDLDVGFSRLLIDDLDVAGMAAELRQVLESLPSSDLDDHQQIVLVRLMWEADELEALTEFVSLWNGEQKTLPTQVLGYMAMAQARLGREDEAESTISLLDSREDMAAKGWVTLIRTVGAPDPVPSRVRIEASRAAIDIDSRNPLSWYELGVAYRDTGENALAVRAFFNAAKRSRHWAAPAEWGARLLVKQGDWLQAMNAAAIAARRSTRDPRMRILNVMRSSAKDASLGTSYAAKVLRGLDDAVEASEISAESARPLRIALLTDDSAGTIEEARTLVREILDQTTAPADDLLLACADLSRLRKMGLEGECYARYAKSYGITPELALARARNKLETDGTDAARGLFQALRKSSDSERDDPFWIAAEAACLESVGRTAEATAVWSLAASRAPGDPAIQRGILASRSLWGASGDPEVQSLLLTAIDNLGRATAGRGLWSPHYEGRLLLAQENPPAEDVERARLLLEKVLADAPEFNRSRPLLAQAYEHQGLLEEAVRELEHYRARRGRSIPVGLRIAQIQLDLGRRRVAEDELRAMRVPGDPAQLKSMAALYARLRENHDVTRLLRTLDKIAPDPESYEELMDRAGLRAAAGNYGPARRHVERAVKLDPTPEALLLAATVARFQVDDAAADAFLGRFAVAEPLTLERERRLAMHHWETGNMVRAEAHRQAAVELEGAEKSDWRNLLVVQLLQGESRTEDLLRTLERARERGMLVEGDDATALDGDLLRIAAARGELQRLGAAYIRDDERRDVAREALGVLGLESAEVGSPGSGRLRGLLQENADFLALQMAAVYSRLSASEGEAPREAKRAREAALDIAREAMGRFPTHAAPAKAAAYCFRALGYYLSAVDAALKWSELAPWARRPAEAFVQDCLVAEAKTQVDLGVTNPFQGILRKVPDLAPALIPRALRRLARELAKEGKADVARALLKRESGRALRVKVARIQIDLAESWLDFARVTGDDSDRGHGDALLAGVVENPDSDANDLARVGAVHEAGGNRELAEAAYREALARQAGNVYALNNLAMLLTVSGRAEEALPLVRKALEIRPGEAELHDTLAEALARTGDLAGARRELEKCLELAPREAARWNDRLRSLD